MIPYSGNGLQNKLKFFDDYLVNKDKYSEEERSIKIRNFLGLNQNFGKDG